MTVKQIVAEWLKEHGYDGLYNWGHYCGCECGCKLDDLMPCGEGFSNCQAGVRIKCSDCMMANCDRRGNDCIQPRAVKRATPCGHAD
jgi:hypothetical protein